MSNAAILAAGLWYALMGAVGSASTCRPLSSTRWRYCLPVADVQVFSTSLIMSDGVEPVHNCVILVGRLHTFPTVTPALEHALRMT